MAAHGTPSSHKPDPQYRQQDHVVFAALVIPIFVVTFVIVVLVVTLGPREPSFERTRPQAAVMTQS